MVRSLPRALRPLLATYRRRRTRSWGQRSLLPTPGRAELLALGVPLACQRTSTARQNHKHDAVLNRESFGPCVASRLSAAGVVCPRLSAADKHVTIASDGGVSQRRYPYRRSRASLLHLLTFIYAQPAHHHVCFSLWSKLPVYPALPLHMRVCAGSFLTRHVPTVHMRPTHAHRSVPAAACAHSRERAWARLSRPLPSMRCNAAATTQRMRTFAFNATYCRSPCARSCADSPAVGNVMQGCVGVVRLVLHTTLLSPMTAASDGGVYRTSRASLLHPLTCISAQRAPDRVCFSLWSKLDPPCAHSCTGLLSTPQALAVPTRLAHAPTSVHALFLDAPRPYRQNAPCACSYERDCRHLCMLPPVTTPPSRSCPLPPPPCNASAPLHPATRARRRPATRAHRRPAMPRVPLPPTHARGSVCGFRFDADCRRRLHSCVAILPPLPGHPHSLLQTCAGPKVCAAGSAARAIVGQQRSALHGGAKVGGGAT
ncbi:hypothetical protein GGX14DRAFT_655267 [Mycena pura]|uniref:Uncharacterized protein n=1 Tax=Mycena pura TaxID=153505 RepID=A0AAD6V3P5_9AGAR|nr:hypothetical protein GGX14DRAFT_655267 [Mycena pura]